MQQAVPVGEGAMSAIVAPGVSEAGLSDLISDLGVDVANLNSLDQVVISGPTAAVALIDLSERGARVLAAALASLDAPDRPESP